MFLILDVDRTVPGCSAFEAVSDVVTHLIYRIPYRTGGSVDGFLPEIGPFKTILPAADKGNQDQDDGKPERAGNDHDRAPHRQIKHNFPCVVVSEQSVVFQKIGGSYQFAPIKDGRYKSVKVTSLSKEAVRRVLDGEDYSQGALYFFQRSSTSKSKATWFDKNLKYLFKYGAHEFFTEWK